MRRPGHRKSVFRRGRIAWVAVAAASLLHAGCFGSSAISVPSISPDEAGRLALAEYDANGDGFLDAKELERCPALKGALKNVDKNGDGKLSADEISQRLAEFVASNTGIIGVPCRVQLNDTALEGATVTFVPEKFMGAGFAPASGVSDSRGQVILQLADQSVAGTRWGYYRIEVSKKDAAGVETLPPRYNTATTLGQEIAPDRREAIVLRLLTK